MSAMADTRREWAVHAACCVLGVGCMPGHLHSPPIVEVVCGVVFEPQPGIDPVMLGAYWASRRDDLPQHQLLPAITDPGTIVFGTMPPGRVWLVSSDEAWVVQIQADRFYVNWRKRQGSYPRFSPQKYQQSMLDRVLEEFDRFVAFCAEFGQLITPVRIELAKIDHLVRGVHWRDVPDLISMVPLLRAVMSNRQTDDAPVLVRRIDTRPGGTINVTIGTSPPEQIAPIALVSMDTRVRREIVDQSSPLHDVLRAANRAANEIFDELIPVAEHHRFMGQE